MPHIKRTLKDRILSKIRVHPETGCWEWIGSLKPQGYGQITLKRGSVTYAHRVSYEEFVGPIPEGLVLDHLCHKPEECAGGSTCPHRRCVNPNHLKLTTQQENINRGGSPGAILHRSDYCRNGHPRTPENRAPSSKGERFICQACVQANLLKHRAARNRRQNERRLANLEEYRAKASEQKRRLYHADPEAARKKKSEYRKRTGIH